MGGLGAAQRARIPTSSTTCRATRTGCRSSCSTRGRAGRSRSSPCPCSARNRTLGALILTGSPGIVRRGLPPRSGDPGQPGGGHALAHQGPRAPDGARRPRRPDRPLQPARLQRPARAGGGPRGPAERPLRACSSSTSTTSRSSTTPTDTRRATRRLRATARVLTQHLRKGDQAARYGGEEFVVILPGTDQEGALRLAERVRSALEKHRLVFEGARIAISASFGVGDVAGRRQGAGSPARSGGSGALRLEASRAQPRHRRLESAGCPHRLTRARAARGLDDTFFVAPSHEWV